LSDSDTGGVAACFKREKTMEFKLKALSDIWTGGVEGDKTKLHLTGIKGSIRWWYEALIRGLHGYACDPSSGNGCKLNLIEFKKHVGDGKDERKVLEALNLQICPACQMFGCTNWGSKFILRIENNHKSVITNQIKGDTPFKLKFIERKRFTITETKLINAAVKIITDYGAIGGKTTLKPSEKDFKNTEQYKDINGRIRKHHFDYGLIVFQPNQPSLDTDCKELSEYLKQNKANLNKENEKDWPDLINFWFVKGAYIDRTYHNQLISRNINGKYNNGVSDNNIFMGGFTPKDKDGDSNSVQNAISKREDETTRNTESKKIFSFHGIKPAAIIKENAACNESDLIQGAMRCFGYSKKDDLREVIGLVIEHIKGDYSSLVQKIKCGTEVLDEL